MMLLYIVGVCICVQVAQSVESVPRGHNEWLGFHRPAEGHIDVLTEVPTPQKFWEDYCSLGKPVLLKGVALDMPARLKWTDEYMRENYGDLRVKLESKYEKDFKPEGDRGMGQDSMRRFLDTYIEHDKYMVSQLPDPLSEEVTVPQPILCGSFRERILEANIWMSSGNTKSLLHRDADNAFNCLLNGTKDWILIDPVHQDLLPVAVESGSPYGGYTLINVNKVDLIEFPAFQEVPWYYANISAGDCLFLPKGHWHQVRSYGAKNLAVSILFSRLNDFNPKGCPKEGVPPSELLSEVPMVWTYDGFGAQTMGNTDPFELKDELEMKCKHGDGKLTLEMFEEDMISGLDIEEEAYKGTLKVDADEYEIPDENIEIMKQRAKAIMDLIDPENIGYYDCSQLEDMTVDTLKKISDIKDPDPANTDQYEFLHLHPNLVRKTILSSLELSKESFMEKYHSHEGSMAGAEWIFETLDSDNDGRCTLAEVKGNMEKVLERFQDSLLADVTAHQAKKINQNSKDEL